MTNYFDTCKKENGSVNYNGVEYALLSQAAIDSDNEGNAAYFAAGFSRQQLADYHADYDGDFDPLFAKHARVMWSIVDGFDGDDESNACDWENPTDVELRG